MILNSELRFFYTLILILRWLIEITSGLVWLIGMCTVLIKSIESERRLGLWHNEPNGIQNSTICFHAQCILVVSQKELIFDFKMKRRKSDSSKIKLGLGRQRRLPRWQMIISRDIHRFGRFLGQFLRRQDGEGLWWGGDAAGSTARSAGLIGFVFAWEWGRDRIIEDVVTWFEDLKKF